ncbi:hypothetical protein Bca4012_057620 [Brassica carinata]
MQNLEAIDWRTIVGTEDCPEGDPKGQAGEAGLTKTRSGYHPEESTPDVEAPPEIDTSVTWEPSTKCRGQHLTNGVTQEEASGGLRHSDTSPFPQAEDSKDFRHQNKEEAGYSSSDTPSGTEKNKGVDMNQLQSTGDSNNRHG